MELRLISFAGCPFVQRAVIVLDEKRVGYEVTYIDLEAKPEWFLQLSPRGKVPVLVVDGRPLFESSAIVEFLEETHPEPPLLPADPFLRARDRGWVSLFADELYAPLWTLLTRDGDAAARAAASIDALLERLDEELAGRQWLSGDGTRFGFADAAAAPFFMRAQIAEEVGLWSRSARASERAWSERLLARPSVARSVPGWYLDGLRADLEARAATAEPRP